MHVTQQIIHAVKGLPTHLAFERLDWRVHYHMGLERLLLNKGLKAGGALVGTDTGVDQHMSLHVGM